MQLVATMLHRENALTPASVATPSEGSFDSI